MYAKLGLLFANIIVFTLIYFILDDSHFSGINSIQTMLKDELMRKKVEDVVSDRIDENAILEIEQFQEYGAEINIQNQPDEKIQDIIIEEKKEIETKVNDMALETEKDNNWARLYDRFYFSVVTGTTLGYGDIYPDSRLSKLLVIIELFISISIVFFM